MPFAHAYLDDKPSNDPDPELRRGYGTQSPDSEGSDAEGGHVQNSHNDSQSCKGERTVGDYEKADAQPGLTCHHDEFNGFSDSSSTSFKLQKKVRSKGR